MEVQEKKGYHFVLKIGTNNKIILLLHGWGGDEFDLLKIGENLDPESTLISPRGKVIQNGMNRFFARGDDMKIDMRDLQDKTKELKEFIHEVVRENNLDGKELIGLGFSNGAGMLYSLIQSFPNLLKVGVLLRPVLPPSFVNFDERLSEEISDFAKVRLFISSAENDSYITLEESKELHQNIQKYNPNTFVYISPKGHQLTEEDIKQFVSFYYSNSL